MTTYILLLLTVSTVRSNANQLNCPQSTTDLVGCLIPRNPYVFVGNNLSMNCILRDGEGSQSLFFRVGDTNVSSEYQRPTSPAVMHLNLPIIDTRLQAVTVYCLSSALGSVVGEQQLEVEYAPRNMTNVHIVLEEWRSLHVRWTRPKYVRSEDVTTSVVWTALGALSSYECTSQTDTSCTISGTDYNDSPVYYVIISVRNTRTNDTHTQELVIHPNRYARTSGVELLPPVSPQTARCVTLHWRHKRHTTRHLVFRVNITGAFTTTRSYIVSSLFIRKCGLHPDVEYRVGVSAGVADSMYWSREHVARLSTLETYPERGADVTPGLYCVTENQCVEGVRTVRVYLRPPDEIYWNGELTNYTLVFVPSDASFNMSATPEITLVSHQVQLYCHLEYDVNISVYNKIGGSPPSLLHIPRHDKVAGPITVRVSDRGSTLHVEWAIEKEEKERIGYWLVVWCNATAFCKSAVSWRRVSAPSTTTLVSRNYSRYGIAMVTRNNQSSGIVWASCTYEYDKVPRRAPELVRLKADSHLALTVSWRLETCTDRVLVAHYIVQYCLHLSKSCKTEEVGSKTSQLQLQQLEEGQLYDVRLKLVTVAGQNSTYSPPLSATPVYIGLRAGHLVGIAVGSLIVCVIILIAGATCFRRTIRRWREREDIEVPLKPISIASVGETQTSAHFNTVPTRPCLQEGNSVVHAKLRCEQAARLPLNYALLHLPGSSLADSSISRTETDEAELSPQVLDSGSIPGCDDRDSLTSLEKELEDTGSGSEDEDSVPYIAVGEARD